MFSLGLDARILCIVFACSLLYPGPLASIWDSTAIRDPSEASTSCGTLSWLNLNVCDSFEVGDLPSAKQFCEKRLAHAQDCSMVCMVCISCPPGELAGLTPKQFFFVLDAPNCQIQGFSLHRRLGYPCFLTDPQVSCSSSSPSSTS